ncbi:MAG: hypothetical protein ACFHU9_17135 [Fluviicola sp.]
MRKILVLVLSIYSFMGIAQDIDNGAYRFGVQVSADDPIRFANWMDLKMLFSLQGTYSNNKHQFDAGVMFAPLRNPQYEQKLGMRFGYTFYPNGRGQLFSSYLRFSLPFHFVKDVPVTYAPFGADPSYGIEHRYWNVHIQGGYGIQLNLGNKVYLGSDISMLFGSYVRKYEYYDWYNDENRRLDEWGLSLYPQFGVNLGYRF